MTQISVRKPKKSESLEVRLPFETKQAFMAACEAGGASASEAVRGFIDSYIEPPSPVRSRGLGWKTSLRLAAGAATLAAVAAVAAPSLAVTGLAAQFSHADADRSAALSFTEFSRAIEVRAQVGPKGFAARAPLDGEARATLVRDAFVQADANRDGRISLAEFRKAYAG